MITRCPSCRTAFKVVPDQLRIAAGWVRCGHCGELFDGRSHLVDETPERTPSVRNDVPPASRAEEPAPTPESAPPVPQRGIGHQSEAGTEDAEVDFQPTLAMELEEPSLSERLAAERQHALEQQQAQERENEQRAEALRQDAERQRADQLRAERLEAERAEARRLEAELERAAQLEAERRADAERQEAERQGAEEQRADAPAPFAARDAFSVFSTGSENLAENRFASSTPAMPGEEHNEPRFRFDQPAIADPLGLLATSPITPEAAPADPSLPREPALGHDPFMGPRRPPMRHRAAEARDAMPSFVRSRTVHRFWDSAAVRALLWIALPILIVALAAQWVLHERDWLAARTPALAPLLNTLCAPLGCAVQPYRMLNAIAIDGSDFRAINADTFRFDLSVRNSADVAVAMPAFQLTLSDAQGQVLVRRVIQTAELDAPATLKPHGEFDATRALHIAGVAHPEAITSYRVVAFYP